MVEVDDEYIDKVTQTACQIIEVHSPNRKWQVDQIIRVLTLAGRHVKDQSIATFLQLIAATPDLQAYSISKLFNALKENKYQDALVRVALWSLGEFGELIPAGETQIQESSVLELIEDLVYSISSSSIKNYSLNCLIKLATKFSSESQKRIPYIIESLQRDQDSDVQQRALEYGRILTNERLTWDQKRLIFDSMPVAKVSMNIFHSY